MDRLKQLWNGAAHFFEYGDLTPLAVIVSVAHYGPVLDEKGEHWLVAWAIGALIDLIHYRTVRWLFNHPSWWNVAVGLLTTMMATGYHFRFYDGDALLALPIPLGIAILAYHAATHEQEVAEDLQAIANDAHRVAGELQKENSGLQERIRVLQEKVKGLQTRISSLQASNEALQQEKKAATAEATAAQVQLQEWRRVAETWQQMSPRMQAVALHYAEEIDLDAAAQMAGVSAATIRRDVQRMNGSNDAR